MGSRLRKNTRYTTKELKERTDRKTERQKANNWAADRKKTHDRTDRQKRCKEKA